MNSASPCLAVQMAPWSIAAKFHVVSRQSQKLHVRPAVEEGRVPPLQGEAHVQREVHVEREVHGERVLGICLAAIALHLAVVAVLFPGGASVLARASLLLGAVLGPPAVLWLGRLSRLARVLVVGVVGLGALLAGLATSVAHAALTGASGSDFTGLAATAAGAVLVGIAFRNALSGRHLAVKLVAGVLGVVVIAQWLIAPALNIGLITHAPRTAAASAATLGYPDARNVGFQATDGVWLAGWYVPGRNGAAVILLHGSHDTRSDTLPYLRLLHAAGYAVLAFDARGHGQSQGQTNALGWYGARDVAGAVRFLERQPGVDARRIAALGLSMGAEEALRAAATGVPLSAIVADGAGASTLTDSRLLPHSLSPVFTSETWLTMLGTELVTGETEPAGLSRLVARIHVPVLLIASNASGERTLDRIYRDRIGPNASLWYLPDAAHTAGLSTHPARYAARVDSFLATALAGR
ncbi:MAG: alpha/beta hydrolase [Solirubrobacteraceae bacterium]